MARRKQDLAHPDEPFIFDTARFIMSTQHMTTGQIGALGLLMFAAWANGPIPDDDERLATITKSTKKEWGKLRPIMAEQFDIADGKWFLPRPDPRVVISTSKARKIREAAGNRCTYCEHVFVDEPRHPKAMTVDHVHPVSRGGTNADDNLVAACWECNRSKSDRLLHEWKPLGSAS